MKYLSIKKGVSSNGIHKMTVSMLERKMKRPPNYKIYTQYSVPHQILGVISP